MMTLLYKELRLAAHPASLVFACLGCLVLVPAYPYSVIFLFGCLAPYITFLHARETNDAWYTAVLPVTKRESVLGKCLLVLVFQVFQLVFSVPFALLRHALHIANNPVGLDATAAWYGMGFFVYGVFDLVFLTAFYKNGYKVGQAFLLAAIPMALLMTATEAAAHLPALAWMDSCQPEHLRMQLPNKTNTGLHEAYSLIMISPIFNVSGQACMARDHGDDAIRRQAERTITRTFYISECQPLSQGFRRNFLDKSSDMTYCTLPRRTRPSPKSLLESSFQSVVI